MLESQCPTYRDRYSIPTFKIPCWLTFSNPEDGLPVTSVRFTPTPCKIVISLLAEPGQPPCSFVRRYSKRNMRDGVGHGICITTIASWGHSRDYLQHYTITSSTTKALAFPLKERMGLPAHCFRSFPAVPPQWNTLCHPRAAAPLLSDCLMSRPLPDVQVQAGD